MNIKDRVAIITGSGSGIGQAIAIKLSELGAKVIVNDLNEINIKETIDKIKIHNGESYGYKADVTHENEVISMFNKIDEIHGRIDIVVNNVGISKDSLIHKMNEEIWDDVLNVNLKSYFLVTKEATKRFIEQKYGRIINISSRAWLGGFGQANYSAAKGGIISLTRTSAIELSKHNVTANAIAPGLIDTPLVRSLRKDAQERLINMQPINRIGNPEEVANAVAFFASDNSGYITGQTLHVCGGKSLGARW